MGNNNNSQNDNKQNNDAAHRQRILHQTAHPIFKKGNGFTHHILLSFLFLRCLFKLLQINLKA